MSTGWEYDESYKKAIEKPCTWEESTTASPPLPAANSSTWSVQPANSAALKSEVLHDSMASSWNHDIAPGRRPSVLGSGGSLLSSPNYPPSSNYTLPQHSRSGFSHNPIRGQFSSTYPHRQYGLFSTPADNVAQHGTRGVRYDDYSSHSSYGAAQHDQYNKPAYQRTAFANYGGRANAEMLEEQYLSKLKISDSNVECGINFDAYEEIPVEVTGDHVPLPIETFDTMECESTLHQNIKRCGYTQPTPVQKYAIPICMNGRDLMACAQTGSGKTAAFCLPIIAGVSQYRSLTVDNAKNDGYCSPLALILSPTRELASQIHAEAKKFAFETRLRVAVVYGGAPIILQLNELDRGVDILVATPGRLKDVIERRRVSLAQVKYLVIDEADRMLDMGFKPQIQYIVNQVGMPNVGKRQTLLFSATFPQEIQELAGDFLSNYIFLSVGRVGSSTDLIEQRIEYTNDYDKRNRLMELLHEFSSGTTGKKLMVVFVETKKGADFLESWLCQMGWRATSIHGDRTQHERERALKSFKSGSRPILVATDVAARGLDVPNVAHVVNYDLPNEIDSYVHRIGRTGRAGKMGTATAFFTDKNSSLAKPLVELLAESKQDVPSWLLKYAAPDRYDTAQSGSRQKSYFRTSSGGASKFGGRDFRSEKW